MKKFLLTISIFVFALSVLAIPAEAASAGTISIVVSADVVSAEAPLKGVHPGEKVTITFRVANSVRVGGLDFNVSLPEGFTITDSQTPSGLTGSFNANKFSGYSEAGVMGPFDALRITCEVQNTATVGSVSATVLQDEEWVASDPSENDYTPSITPASITVYHRDEVDADHNWGPVTWPDGEPDCESGGTKVQTCQTAGCGHEKRTYVEKLGHNWGAEQVTWNNVEGPVVTKENVTCTVTRHCDNPKHQGSPDDTVTCTVADLSNKVTSKSTTATCMDPEKTTFTATGNWTQGEKEEFSFDSDQVTTKEALGHQWGEPEFVWSGDYPSVTVTATRKCTREGATGCGGTVQNPEGEVTKVGSEAPAATCQSPGSITYTATATFKPGAGEGAENVEKQDTSSPYTIPQLEHKYVGDEPTWGDWSRNEEGGYTITASWECEGNPDEGSKHTMEGKVTVTPHSENATCTQAGTVTYTAEATFEGKEGTYYPPEGKQNHVVYGEKAGHQYNNDDVVWEWPTDMPTEDGEFRLTGTVKASRTCTNPLHNTDIDGDKVQTTDNVTIENGGVGEGEKPTCTKEGALTYAATAHFPEQTESGNKAEDVKGTTTIKFKSLGHKYPAEWEEVTEQTCGQDGRYRKECERCGTKGTGAKEEPDWEIFETRPATGKHTPASDFEVTKQPTYEEAGEEQKECEVCHQVLETRSVDKLKAEPTGSVTGGSDKVEGDAGAQLKTEAQSILDAGLAHQSVPGVPSEITEAIWEAGQSAEPGSLQVSMELEVVEGSANSERLGSAAEYEITVTYKVDGKEAGGTVIHKELDVTQTQQTFDFKVTRPGTGPIWYVERNHEGEGWKQIPSKTDSMSTYFSSNLFSNFAIMSTNDINFANVDPIPDQTYTGSAITPKVVVYINGDKENPLVEGTDYELEWSNNVNVGTATVTIKALAANTHGLDAASTKTVTFSIVAAPSGGSGSGGATSPNTGDEAPLALYAGMLTLCLAGLAGIAVRRRKNK